MSPQGVEDFAGRNSASAFVGNRRQWQDVGLRYFRALSAISVQRVGLDPQDFPPHWVPILGPNSGPITPKMAQ